MKALGALSVVSRASKGKGLSGVGAASQSLSQTAGIIFVVFQYPMDMCRSSQPVGPRSVTILALSRWLTRPIDTA